MFCYQCEEAMNNTGCNKSIGMCGKTQNVAILQDVLVYSVKKLSKAIIENNIKSEKIPNINKEVLDALFMTITNSNFNEDAIVDKIRIINKERIKITKENHKCDAPKEKILEFGKNLGVFMEKDEDLRSLKEFITYGVKGIAAYGKHGANLGFKDYEIYDFIYFSMSEILKEKSQNELLEILKETGKYSVKVMCLLDKANTSTYGNPEITKVNIGVKNNPGILISGHDLKDLQMLLEQSKNQGVDIYTHGEMLPAHYYPFFKKYTHFVGNYGNSWWKQNEEFETFNGPILFTTNCIVPPKNEKVKERIFTTGSSGFKGCKHIKENEQGFKDFSPIINLAKKLPSPKEIEKGLITGGFAHNQVLALKDTIIENIKNGSIKQFVVMAGCDGRKNSRQYYEDFAKKLPNTSIILTAGCAKYRYNKLNLGNINGIPRVLDAGQCNDSYSLIVIALKLKEILGLDDVNKLPIFYNISWYEQKAVTVLLALLSLGVKNIHIGPSLPAFLSENVKNILIKQFGISTITTVENDINLFINK